MMRIVWLAPQPWQSHEPPHLMRRDARLALS